MALTFATQLETAIREVCPIINGVSVGRKNDSSTWRANFPPEITEDEREAARPAVQAVIDAFMPDPETTL